MGARALLQIMVSFTEFSNDECMPNYSSADSCNSESGKRTRETIKCYHDTRVLCVLEASVKAGRFILY